MKTDATDNSLESSTIPGRDPVRAFSLHDTPEFRGQSVQEISSELALDAVRDGNAENPGSINLPKPMLDALTKEKKAMAALAAAQAAREAAQVLVIEWEGKISLLRQLQGQTDFIRSTVQAARAGLAEERARFNRYLQSDINQAIGSADFIATREAAFPILAAAETAHADTLAAHIAEMLTWGAANGVPADVLAELKTSGGQN